MGQQSLAAPHQTETAEIRSLQLAFFGELLLLTAAFAELFRAVGRLPPFSGSTTAA